MSKELFYSLLLFLYKSCIKYKFDLYLQIKYYCMNKRYQTGYIKQKPYSLNIPSFNLNEQKPITIPTSASIDNLSWLDDIGSIAGGISGVIGTSLQNSKIEDTSDVESQIDSALNYKVGAQSNESLLDEWGNYNPLDFVTYSDVRGGNTAQRGLNVLSSIGSGAMGGASIGGPVGAIAGGIVGLGSSIAGWLTGDSKARRKTRELNNKIEAANRHVQGAFVNAAKSIDELNDMNILSNYSAYGGPVNMRSFSPMSPFGNRYSKGGSIRIKPSKRGTFTAAAKKHGKSVQAFASQVLANKENYSPAMVKKANFARNAARWKHADGGNLNTVAPLVYPAPEWIYNPLEEPDNAPVYSPDNYISDAQYIADRWAAENSIKEGWDPNTNTYSPHPSAEGGKKTVGPGIKLGAYKGFTQDRPYTIEELNNQVVKISREKEKHIKKVLGTDTISPQIMRGLVDLSYQIKGDIAKKYPLLLEAVKEGNLNKIKEEAKVHYTPKGKTKPIEDTRRNKFREDNFWYYELGGPINTHGGVFDNGVTIVGNGGTHEENPLEGVQMGVDEQGIPNLVEEGEVIFNDYVFSNRIEAPKNLKRRYKFKGKTFADVAKSIQKESEERPNDPISKAGLDVNMARLAMSQEEVRNSKMKKRTSNKYAGGGVLPYMRYAPAVGAGINALTDLIGSTNKYDYSNIDLIQDVIDNLQTVSYKPVGNYLTYRPFDRNFYINKLNSQASATRRAIEGLSGGNRATKIAGIVASDYNTQGRLGDLARQAEEYNLAQRERVEAFNRGTNQFNSEMGLRVGQINKQNDELRLKSAITQAQLRDQIDSAVSAARSANLNNFLDSLGDIGREETIFNLINSNPGLRYGYTGRTGNIGYKTRSKGGYLTIKKKK
nr:MAG TPA: Endolysin [Crassvirales sp.]